MGKDNKKVTMRIFIGITFSVFILGFGMCRPGFANEEEWQALNMKARELLINGDAAAAIEVAQKALDSAKTDFGPGHPNVVKSLNNIGVIYFVQGDLARAESHYQEALKTAEQYLGAEDPLIGDTLINLSKLTFMQEKFAETLTALKRAYEIRSKQFGKVSQETGAILSMLAQVYSRMGLAAEAEETKKELMWVLKSSENQQPQAS